MANEDRSFREVFSYAQTRGFGTGFPNFHQADYGLGVVHGTVLIGEPYYELRFVPIADFGTVNVTNVPGMMQAATRYAGAQSLGGAFPTFYRTPQADGEYVPLIALPSASVVAQRVSGDDLGNPDSTNVGAMFRAVAGYADTNGYPAGFPTFDLSTDQQGRIQFGVCLLRPEAAWTRDVPRSELALFSRDKSRFAILLCTFKDQASHPHEPGFYETFFTEVGAGTSGAYDYWRDVSLGGIDVSQSMVFGWFKLDHELSELEVLSDPNDPDSPTTFPPEIATRDKIFEWGRDAAKREGVPLQDYPYTIVVCPGGGHGAVALNKQGLCIGYVNRTWEPGFCFHEMGHALGLPHSRADGKTESCGPGNDKTVGAYCDPYDMMSWGQVQTFDTDVVENGRGPGLNAVNLTKLDCLPDARVWRPKTWSFNEEIVLAALSRPDMDAFLAARFELSTIFSTFGATTDSFVIEYRQQERWDRGLRGNVVLIHRIDDKGHSFLVDVRKNFYFLSEWDGFELPDASPRVRGRVISIDPAAHTATIQVWNSTLNLRPSLRIADIIANPPGSDMPEERVIIENTTSRDVGMNGWALTDLADHRYGFSQNFVLPSGRMATIWTKEGVDDPVTLNYFMNRRAPIWNNTGDTAILTTFWGSEVSRLVYLPR